MIKYVIKRLFLMIPVMLGVAFLLYGLLSLATGDAARVKFGEDASEEVMNEWREEKGLNDPLIIQYGRYVGNLVTKGSLGTSYLTDKPVTEMLMARFPVTLKLAVVGLCVMLIIGVPIGIISAIKQYTWIDTLMVSIGMLGVSLPNFWVALMLIIIFSQNLGILPASGMGSAANWIMPAIAVGIGPSCTMMRTTRSSVLECVRQDYVRTARSKGQKEGKVVIHHVLRNALIPVVTVSGIQFGALMGGAVVIESIFSLPGLGKLIVDNIATRDYPVVIGGVLVIALAFSLVNLVVDILYTVIDPRIKTQFEVKKKKKTREEAV